MYKIVSQWLSQHPATVQVMLACLALLAGVLVYVFDRDPEKTYFLAEIISLHDPASSVFGGNGGHLPDFLHIYAFILLSCATLRPNRGGLLKISLLWLLIESLFEFGQHPTLAPVIATCLPEWFTRVPILENAAGYFLNGVFGLYDLLAIFGGAIAAYLTVRLMPPYRD